MEGNQLLTPQSRALIAAAAFAIVSIVILLVVWYAPAFFKMKVTGGREEELSTEEKLAILAQVRASEPEAFDVSGAEKAAALEAVSDSSVAPETNEEEKMRIMQSLRTR